MWRARFLGGRENWRKGRERRDRTGEERKGTERKGKAM
jgi:hypothetical protein